jgi:hypothetical protein
MKKISFAFLLTTSLLFASNNVIELSGKYSENLGNPFRALLEKKDKEISIFSQNKEVVLKVESNLDNDSIYNMRLEHPKTFILKNKSVENIVEDYYAEEYKVLHKKGGVEVNVLSGKVILDYMNMENNQQIHNLKKVEVELNVEINKNGVKTTKTILMDNKLGITSKNFKWSIVSSDFKNLDLKNLSESIQSIIETEIYTVIKAK